MQCTRCQQQYCWLCLAPWQPGMLYGKGHLHGPECPMRRNREDDDDGGASNEEDDDVYHHLPLPPSLEDVLRSLNHNDILEDEEQQEWDEEELQRELDALMQEDNAIRIPATGAFQRPKQHAFAEARVGQKVEHEGRVATILGFRCESRGLVGVGIAGPGLVSRVSYSGGCEYKSGSQIP